MKIGIINNSTAGLDYIDTFTGDYKTARMRILMEGKEYVDFVEITAPEFFEKVRNDHSITPTTSTPNMIDYLDLMKELEDEGCDQILLLSFSSALSNAYQVARMAAEEYDGKAEIVVYDTKAAAVYEGMFTIEAVTLRDQGKSMEEIIEALDHLHNEGEILFVVDTLRQLIKNGRLSNAAGFVGNILKIKPFLHMDKEGKLVNVDKVRTSKKALQKMVDYFFEKVEGMDDFECMLITSDYPEGDAFVRNQIEAKYPDKKWTVACLTPVIGAHTAEGCVGLGYIKR